MRASDLSLAAWRKSGRSNNGGGGARVEVAEMPGRVAMRDPKDPAGLVLAFTHTTWRAFFGGVQTREFD